MRLQWWEIPDIVSWMIAGFGAPRGDRIAAAAANAKAPLRGKFE